MQDGRLGFVLFLSLNIGPISAEYVLYDILGVSIFALNEFLFDETTQDQRLLILLFIIHILYARIALILIFISQYIF